MLQGAIIGALIGLVLAICGYGFSMTRRPPATIRNRPLSVVTLSSNLTQEEVANKLRNIPSSTKYKLESGFQSNEFVLLHENPSATTWGFYYPVFLSQENGRTKIEIGTKSKIYQVGPLVTKATNRFVETVNRSLTV